MLQSMGLGQAGAGQQIDFSRFGLDTLLGMRGAATDQIGATGEHAQAIGGLAGQTGGGGGVGDFLGTAASMLGLFSDAFLKDNIKRIGSLGDFGWYTWDWNDEAKRIGADSQPNYGVIAQEVQKVKPELVSVAQGYLTVDYRGLV
jgi:hypothetical protein